MHITLEWTVIIALAIALISGMAWTLTTVYKLTHSSSTHSATLDTDIKYVKSAVDGLSGSVKDLSGSISGKIDKITEQVADHETRITLLENK